MAGAAADEWVHVAEEESDSDESFFSSTDSMDDDDDSYSDWTEVNDNDGDSKDDDTVTAGKDAATTEAGGGDDAAVCTTLEEADAAHGTHKIDGETAVVAAEEHDDDIGQGTDAEALYYGGYMAAAPVGYDYGYDYAQDGYYPNSFPNGVGNGGDDYVGFPATDAEAAYYGYGTGSGYSCSYGSHGGYGYGYGDGYGAGSAYGYGYGGGYGAPASAALYQAPAYGFVLVQDGGAMYQALGYDPYAATTKPLEVRLCAPSGPLVFVDAGATDSSYGVVPVYPAP